MRERMPLQQDLQFALLSRQSTMQDGNDFEDDPSYVPNHNELQYTTDASMQHPMASDMTGGLAASLDTALSLGYQDGSGHMWTANTMTPLQTAFDQSSDLHLIHSAQVSPVLGDFYGNRRSSAGSVQDHAEWQEKARNERRKVQNRAAQRAYRERKEKALADMRDLLDRKESQFQALRKDHEELQQKYENLVQLRESSTPSTCNPRNLFKTQNSDDSLPQSVPEQEEG
ncbi:uncharacterized protein AB675_9452 [Cyphellophora attinorum]|uniref:BZIP domain-containing protein n=1 Tax=Cyphellophora attinorum TaxID=1664694 RepID=A0A0N1GX79_9EURO|nr:uncharacterized protein AB675_9452 [Phialophora attinorum]KPI34697.1 hypothetical protein AB675_9452 [Phialophora attinorum]